MTTKEQLIELVIGNKFITSPRLKDLYLTLLDRLEQEQAVNIEKIIEILDKNVEIGYEHNYIDAHYDSLYKIAKEIKEQIK